MISIEKVEQKHDVLELKAMIEAHTKETGSEKGRKLLGHFEEYLPKFKKIIPYDYKKMMNLISSFEQQGLSKEQAKVEAFNAFKKGV